MNAGKYFILVAVTCSLQFISGAIVKNNDIDTKITFPGPIQDRSNRFGKDNVTDPCEDLTYCTVKPDDYPQELFNRMFEGKFKEPIFRPAPVILADRQGDPDEIDDCDSTITYGHLYKVRNKEGKWLKVVQAAKQNFLQTVRLETCNSPGAKCFKQFQNLDGNLVTYCKESYNDWELLVYDDNGKTKKEKISLPMCCSCHFKPS